MKFTLVLVAAGLVAAQDFSGQPECAIPCLRDAIPKVGCALTDTACQCTTEKQQALIPIAAPCLLAGCNSADLTKAQSAAAAACAAFLATATAAPASATGATGSLSATGSVPAAVSSAIASASASVSAALSSASASATALVATTLNSTSVSAATLSASRTASTVVSSTTASATTSTSPNAAPKGNVAVGGLALAAIAGLVAAL
ncbi:hypothetical protein EsH8_III_001146 [Colletotrichum jinshuiense]